jgi:hypothetical protein
MVGIYTQRMLILQLQDLGPWNVLVLISLSAPSTKEMSLTCPELG